MIDAWDIYWVMQLDSISRSLTAVTVVIGIALALGCIFGGVFVAIELHGPDREDGFRKMRNYVGGGAAAFFLLVAVNALLPSSKTAAAMIVLPAITSDAVVQTVAPEARELYELAKDALRSVAKDNQAKEGEAK